jgi:hypothetical protein
MALIQGMENANKTSARFSWCANGGFLEGAGLVPFAHSQLDDRLPWTSVNIVPIRKDIDRASTAQTKESVYTAITLFLAVGSPLRSDDGLVTAVQDCAMDSQIRF